VSTVIKTAAASRNLFPRQLALVLLASAITLPAFAQEAQPTAEPQNTPPPARQFSASTPKEGFWGRVNPFARKKWVNNRVDPLKGQLNELDEVNAKNARDIQDVDGRSQAGIRQAQSAADAANQTASAAGSQARNASGLAQGASTRVDRLNSTVTGLDQYHQANEIEVAFRSGQPILSTAARRQLDEFAASLNGRKGYILEIEGHSPQAGAAGTQSSGRLAEAVKRYLVTENQIPVYRLHSVALGNASAADEDAARPARVRVSSVRIRLMENSLAAREDASPQSAASLTGAERP
jgi:outer membrane protein OmpA-like peptidoglycan-associated protein